MIVKNEAANLSRCLESVKTLVDELIVVDTGSTDETVAIAQQWGATVHTVEWNHNFSDARNQSLKYANGEWILVLDADEVLAPAIIPALQQAMRHENHLVINLLRQEVGASQSPYSLVSRLFRHHPDIRFTRPYHAMIDESVAAILTQESRWQVVDLPEVAILHYGYEPGAIASRDKWQKARSTMEGFLAHHPDDPYVCSKLGALYVQMGELQQGISLLEQGLASPSVDAPVLYELHYHLGIACNRVQKLDCAEHHYRTALQQPILEPLKLGAYNNLGSLLKAKGALKDARVTYEMALAIDPTFAIAHYNLGMTLKALGQMNDAIVHYQQAIHLNSDHAESHQNLGVVLLKLGRIEESMASFGRAIALHAQHDPQEAERLRQGLQHLGFKV